MPIDSAVVDVYEFLFIYALPLTFFTSLIGTIANILGDINGSIYDSLKKPPLSPPPWVFSIVWTLLYTLMAIAYSIVRTGSDPAPIDIGDTYIMASVVIYTILLYSMSFWSWLFFYMYSFWFSFAWLSLCFLLSIGTAILFFFEGGLLPGLMIAPLPLWLLFAIYLNLYIAINNVAYVTCETSECGGGSEVVVKHYCSPSPSPPSSSSSSCHRQC